MLFQRVSRMLPIMSVSLPATYVLRYVSVLPFCGGPSKSIAVTRSTSPAGRSRTTFGCLCHRPEYSSPARAQPLP